MLNFELAEIGGATVKVYFTLYLAVDLYEGQLVVCHALMPTPSNSIAIFAIMQEAISGNLSHLLQIYIIGLAGFQLRFILIVQFDVLFFLFPIWPKYSKQFLLFSFLLDNQQWGYSLHIFIKSYWSIPTIVIKVPLLLVFLSKDCKCCSFTIKEVLFHFIEV